MGFLRKDRQGMKMKRSFFWVVSVFALAVLVVGCPMKRLQPSEEGVTVEVAFLNRSPFGMEGTEVFLFRPVGKGPFPGIILLHGEQPGPTGLPGGKEFYIDGTGEMLATQGFAVMAPSMPGFGDSSGKRDFVGPKTLAKLHAAITHFQKLSYVDSRRIAIYGVSRGATAAALLARRIPDVRALILQSGLYDLRAVTKKEGKKGKGKEMPREARLLTDQIEREAGKSPEAMLRRSPAAYSRELKCPIFLIHGASDKTVPVDQMRRFADQLREQFGDRREVVSREVRGGHVVSGAVVWSEALPFLKRCLSPSKLAVQTPSALLQAISPNK
jgi:dipeptidyl aminopeptidase/acylaminoacyl peptidase